MARHGYGNNLGVRERRQLRKYGSGYTWASNNRLGVRERRRLRKYGNAAGYGGYGYRTGMGGLVAVGLVALTGFALWKLWMRRRCGFGVFGSSIASTSCNTSCTSSCASVQAPASVIPPLKRRAVFSETGFVTKPIRRKYVFRPTLWTRIKSLAPRYWFNTGAISSTGSQIVC